MDRDRVRVISMFRSGGLESSDLVVVRQIVTALGVLRRAAVVVHRQAHRQAPRHRAWRRWGLGRPLCRLCRRQKLPEPLPLLALLLLGGFAAISDSACVSKGRRVLASRW